MANKQLSIVLYRTVWRWARAANGVPYHLRFEDVCTVAPACLQPVGEAICAPSVPLQESAAVRAIARRAFRDSAHLQGQAAADALDRGMEAVRLLHHSYASDVARRRRLASQHAEREGIAYPIGTCFVHRVRGYRGVVYGWDRRCERSSAWAASNRVAPEQPFYFCLPDEDDCQRVFGGVRAVQYVAQDDVDAAPGARITHRALRNWFSGYSAEAGRYVPNRQLAFEYPDAYPEPEVSIAVDANILARPEREPPAAPPASFSPRERFEVE